jgi:hypothetical protein
MAGDFASVMAPELSSKSLHLRPLVEWSNLETHLLHLLDSLGLESPSERLGSGRRIPDSRLLRASQSATVTSTYRDPQVGDDVS